MDADLFIGRWVMIIYDKPTPWQDGIPLGSAFEIFKTAFGDYWFLPSPELKAPMNQASQLEITAENHGGFDVGKLLDGSLKADFGGKVGALYFALNRIGANRRIISLSQSHGGSHAVDS
jgi:hypothetical protein